MKYSKASFAALLLVAIILSIQDADAGQTRLFIFSGQSNMKHLEPGESFIPTFKKAFPEDELIVVKYAISGQPILRWYADWKSASGERPDVRNGKVGDMYETLLAMAKKALEGKPRPESVVFVWMQGEADTHSAGNADVYEASLKAVIKKLRDDLKRPDMYFVVGRISDFSGYPEGSKTVRNALVKVAGDDPRGAWIDTDDLNGKNDGLHYTAEGYKILGERFAGKAIKLLSSAPAPK